MQMAKLASGREGGDHWVEWLVTEDAINIYHGWMTLEFDFGGEPRAAGKYSISFIHIYAKPQVK